MKSWTCSFKLNLSVYLSLKPQSIFQGKTLDRHSPRAPLFVLYIHFLPWGRSFETKQIPCFSSNLLPFILAVDHTCNNENCGVLCFSFLSFIPSTLIHWNSSIGKSCIFSPISLFNYFFISVWVHG